MAEIIDLDVRGLLEAYRSRRLSPLEAIDAVADRIAAVDPGLGAFSALCLERARDEAAVAAQAYRGGGTPRRAGDPSRRPVGTPRPLEGVPFAAKDIFDTAGVVTAYGSAMFAGHVPDTDAEPLARLRAAGAILVGKTRTHEFAWGLTSVNAQAGTPRNPHDPARVAGGSSGGSAVALASRQVPLALGTDTGGSIRIPASFCGCTGIKPTFGAVPRRGVWPLAATLDHVGPMANRVGDLGPVLDVLAGRSMPAGPSTAEPVSALRVGTCPDLELVPPVPEVRAALDRAVAALGERAAAVSTVALPCADQILPAFRTIQGAEAVISHHLAGLFPGRAAEYGADVGARLRAAAAITLEEYADASAVRAELDHRIGELWETVDVIVSPISAVAPTAVADPDHVEHFGRTVELRDCVLPFTTPQDVFGLPACAVPAGVDAFGLPVAVQVWGARGRDRLVLAAAEALEAALVTS